jgi:hypothetical protein
MRHYYKVSIRSEGTGYINDDVNQGEDETTRNCFEVSEHDFKTMFEVRAYLKERYGDIKPSLTYRTTANFTKDIPAGLVYQFDNSDLSHDSSHWSQCDWVDVFKMTAEPIRPRAVGVEVEA